jgi:hypothetical protein
MSQQTARTRTHRLARRAAAVSAGAFALCLAAATPAMADLDPLPDPDLTPVTDALSPVTDVVDPIVPVTDTLSQVEKTAGVTSKTDTVTKPKPKPGTKTTGGDTDSGSTSGGTTRAGHHRHRTQGGVDIKSLMAVPPKNYVSWPGPVADMPGLRNAYAASPVDVEAPAVAAPAAATKHSVISLASGALQNATDPGTPAGRTLLVIISTLTIGTLAGGHVKAAQDRLTASISAG